MAGGNLARISSQSGAVTLIQRFGSALNLNRDAAQTRGYFWPMKPPTPEVLYTIDHKIAKRVSRYLVQTRYLYRDAEPEYTTH